MGELIVSGVAIMATAFAALMIDAWISGGVR